MVETFLLMFTIFTLILTIYFFSKIHSHKNEDSVIVSFIASLLFGSLISIIVTIVVWFSFFGMWELLK